MKKVVFTRFGPPEVLELRDVARPTPRADEVLIRIYATTVTAAEAAMRRGQPLWGRVILGFSRPRRRMRTPGTELAGVIEEVGADVTEFRPGDEVFGFAGFRIGANAEYMRLPARASLAVKPAGLSFAQAAAAVDGASTALCFLRDKAGLRPGERALIIGASGSVGSYAVQLARLLGAEVTGVCSGANVELVTSLGAARVIDYTREDFTTRGERWDVIFDAVGKSSFRRCRASLTANGRYVATTGLANVALAAWTRLRGGPRVITGMSVDKRAELAFLGPLLSSGRLQVVIERSFTLDEIVAAHRLVDSGRKRGNVVVMVRPEAGERSGREAVPKTTTS
ncbi:MAG: NAD(P)-dependent alcohol dehydrogenase [Nannocystaceae bacterium]